MRFNGNDAATKDPAMIASNLTAARRSTRRWNNANNDQRITFLEQFRALLVDGGMSADDASMCDASDVFDGMDTPASAAASRLAA